MLSLRLLYSIFPLLLFLSWPLDVSAKEPSHNSEIHLSPGDNPARETVFVPPLDQIIPVAPDPAWYIKTGAKKGLSGKAETEEELFAAPDIAVLARGYYQPWQNIMAGFEEPVAMTDPAGIVRLIGNKPLLIIPSGALAGTAESAFFNAGLAEYVHSGGVIFCLSQSNGSDFLSLPVPEGRRLEAGGWSDDKGPVVTRVDNSSRHPLVLNINGTDPFMKTDGHFAAIPENGEVLLSSADGFPAGVIYPLGNGWVVVTTLFLDFSSLVGKINPDELRFIANLLSWTRNQDSASVVFDKGKTLTTAKAAANSIILNKDYFRPGETAIVTAPGLGKGALTLSGLAFHDNAIMTQKGSMAVDIPSYLPAGAYPLQWEFEDINGGKKHGRVEINIAGNRVVFRNVSIKKRFEGRRVIASVQCTIHSTQKVSGRLTAVLRGPDGNTSTVGDVPVSLDEGVTNIPLQFTFIPDQSGMWELSSTLHTILPEGIGIPSEPVAVASDSTLFDIGNAIVLGITTGKTFYYDPSGPVEATAYLFGRGKARIEVQADEKRTAGERIQLTGISRFQLSIPAMSPGTHTVKVMLIGDGPPSISEYNLIYGLNLPDLVTDIRLSDPRVIQDQPVLPLNVVIKNRGKTPAAPSQTALFEGDPSKGGVLLMKINVPLLGPGNQYNASFHWPLYNKAGPHALVAVADRENTVTEANKNNNVSQTGIIVPHVFLSIVPDKTEYRTDEDVSSAISLFNLSGETYKNFDLDVTLLNQENAPLFSEKISVGLPKATERKIKHIHTLSAFPAGSYRLVVGLSKDNLRASADTLITILPTLSLTGSLESTPDTVVLCSPFSIQYQVKSTGNIPVSSGTIGIEVLGAGSEKILLNKKVPFVAGANTIKTGKTGLPQGAYTIRLKASAMNRDHGISRDFTLSEKRITVKGPIEAKREGAVFPRVLVWLGLSTSTVENALSRTLIEQAFDHEAIYYKLVDSAEDFSSQAMTGIFNTYILLEPDGLVDNTDWLRNSVSRGQGLAIIGAGENARSLAETFGFTFMERRQETTAIIFARDTGLELSGSLPIGGKMFFPRKKGADSIAVFAEENQPAVLLEKTGNGKITIAPFSLSRSALDSGITSLYSLLLRRIAFFSLPVTEASGGPSGAEITVSSITGPVKAKITETLLKGSRPFWTNIDADIMNNSITFEVTADREPRKLLYLSKQPDKGHAAPATEIFYDCNGTFVSQGKME